MLKYNLLHHITVKGEIIIIESIALITHPIYGMAPKDAEIRLTTKTMSHSKKTATLLRINILNPVLIPPIAPKSPITTEYLGSANRILIIRM